jgi:hypothetical protein
MSFSTKTVSTLPSSLKELVLRGIVNIGESESSVDKIEISLRSTVTTSPTYAALAEGILEVSPLLRGGILPSPEQIWAVMPMSFIIDWIVPMSRYLSDATAYAASPGIPYRVGHTVRIQTHFSSGLATDVFLRSEDSHDLIDPPGDTWLQPSGVPWISIPLAVSMLFGFASR